MLAVAALELDDEIGARQILVREMIVELVQGDLGAVSKANGVLDLENVAKDGVIVSVNDCGDKHGGLLQAAHYNREKTPRRGQMDA